MNIGLIAHDAKKKLMQNFCIAYRGILSKHDLRDLSAESSSWALRSSIIILTCSSFSGIRSLPVLMNRT